jgi:DUF4097 and DUF4098 domain-containing protein YvlB
MEPRSFDTPGGLHLELRIPFGRIQVRAEDTTETRLEIRGERDPDDFRISLDELHAGGHRLTVEHRRRGTMFGWGAGDLRVDVTVPVGTEVAVETGSADLEVTGRIASLDLRSGSGECRFDAVDGDVTVKTASGGLSGNSVGGTLTAYTASGDARIRSVGGEVVWRSASGDISIGAATGAQVNTVSGGVDVAGLRSGATTIRSVSGDVEVGVARGTRVYLDLGSTSGSTVSELDMSSDAGDGGADLDLHVTTVSGDIHVVRSAAAAATP